MSALNVSHLIAGLGILAVLLFGFLFLIAIGWSLTRSRPVAGPASPLVPPGGVIVTPSRAPGQPSLLDYVEARTAARMLFAEVNRAAEEAAYGRVVSSLVEARARETTTAIRQSFGEGGAPIPPVPPVGGSTPPSSA